MNKIVSCVVLSKSKFAVGQKNEFSTDCTFQISNFRSEKREIKERKNGLNVWEGEGERLQNGAEHLLRGFPYT